MGRNHSKLNLNIKSRYHKFKHSDNSSNSNDPPSSIKKFFQEDFTVIDGRKYYNIENLHYYLPSDDLEIDRLQLQHYLVRYTWQSNFSSPVRDLLHEGGARVLDVGCGPATWTLEMAFDFQKCEFIGVDIIPMMPLTIKPQNTDFVEADILEGLPFPDDHFDFTFTRFFNAAFPANCWATHAIPGRYVEFMEWDLEACNQGPLCTRLMSALAQDLESHEIEINIPKKMGSLLQDTGKLKNINHEYRDCPLGKQGGKAGKLALDNTIFAFKCYASKFSKEFGMTLEEYDAHFDDYIKEVDEYKTKVRTHRFWAEKI
ncbi:1226_t:CDS:2 [Cetraspora pellucida]|uniref:1226_t:CDS:1 n=1 Tax=Cetraspora pellucida TaxID=1433469 RepID=A0A9N9BQM9_9GLOM|nr:1226_t:CDS:2 [Cetraspora pellucida]